MSTQPGGDPIGDLQRWLMKAGARSLGRDVADKVKSTIGGGSGGAGRRPADVWEVATTEPPGEEPPECQWCPVCRAARRYRESGGTSGGLGPSLAGVGDTLAGLAQDAFGVFEAAMRAAQAPPGSHPAGKSQPTGQPGPDSQRESDNGTVIGPGVAWPTITHPEHEGGEAADERGDGDERGEPGDSPADGGGDHQV